MKVELTVEERQELESQLMSARWVVAEMRSGRLLGMSDVLFAHRELLQKLLANAEEGVS